MKRFIYIFITLLWMISYATAQETLPCRGTATTVLNVRSGPGTSYARVGQLSHGQEVNVIQKSRNNWVQIEFGSQRGYAYSKYLKFSPLPPKGKLSACQIVFRFLFMEFLVSSMEHHYLGTGYLFGTGGAVLATENTYYLLFHRISLPYLYVQAVESSFLLS